VVGDTEGINVVLLIDNGEDAHSFQPTARDAIAIRTADLVVRAGGADDGFAEKLIEKGKGVDLPLMSAEGITLRCPSISSEEHHEHGEEHHGHSHDYDGHIWLSLKNAAVCVQAISDALSRLAPEKEEALRANSSAYIEKIKALDGRYSAMVSEKQSPRLAVADRFPFVYLTEDYGISYEAAFEGCSADAEAGFDTVLRLADRMNEWSLSALVICEGGDGRLADTVAKQTGREIRTVTLHSMQSVSGEEISSGATYLGIMENNLGALSGALED
jgi:zinc transport system substrate-binding protein